MTQIEKWAWILATIGWTVCGIVVLSMHKNIWKIKKMKFTQWSAPIWPSSAGWVRRKTNGHLNRCLSLPSYDGLSWKRGMKSYSHHSNDLWQVWSNRQIMGQIRSGSKSRGYLLWVCSWTCGGCNLVEHSEVLCRVWQSLLPQGEVVEADTGIPQVEYL